MAYTGGPLDPNFVNQFASTLHLLTETKGGKFAGKSLEDSIESEYKFYDTLSSVTASEVTSASVSGAANTSPIASIAHARRRVSANSYDVGLMIDSQDKLRALVDPSAEYVQRMVSALNRKRDIEFIKGTLGAAAAGKAGADTPVELGASQIIANNNEGLTVAKLREARAKLEIAGIDLDDPMNELYIAVTPKQISDLLAEENVISSDYNNIQALVSGKVNNFLGFNFCVSNLLPKVDDSGVVLSYTNDVPDAGTVADATADGDIRANIVWCKSGVRSVVGQDIKTEIEKRADMRFNWYAYASARFGAVRMEEAKVVRLDCDESVDA